MKAARLFGAKDTRVVEEERPRPGPGQMLLKVKAVAICPSDVRLWEDGHAGGTYPDHPFVQGHEFSGLVEELGPGVDGPPPGTPVAVTPLWPCGKCDLCLDGMDNICRNMPFPSFPQADGAMAEYFAVPASAVAPMPEGMDFIQAALLEPLQAAVHGVGLAGLQPGWTVAVVGAGIIGLNVLQVARACGATKLFAADPIEQNRALALQVGALEAVPYASDLAQLLPDVTSQPRVVFECSGHPAALHQSMDLCRAGGQVVILGVPHPDVIDFDTRAPRRKELHFVFSRRYRARDLHTAIELIRDGKVNLGLYPVRTYPLEKAAEAMQAAYRREPGILRVVVTME
ncbi:MAG: alcohol dehydrogenase catalytic domain-containing protein [Armatimonadetes bacterium]|nr:alcohol dehydrogenase catalytic domain-containing protein [Armatimonadota bacterium]